MPGRQVRLVAGVALLMCSGAHTQQGPLPAVVAVPAEIMELAETATLNRAGSSALPINCPVSVMRAVVA
mgnify:CR=1 FL=1